MPSRYSISYRVNSLEDSVGTISSKQDLLVSGTNIKTINGSSVLGSGDLVVSGSGASWGSITGTLSSQTDLQSAIDAKLDENTAITGATKTKITYDAKGLVTGGSDATTTDITDSVNYRYVTDAQIAAWNALIGGSIFQTTWDASTNSPSLASGVGTKGYYYIVATNGTTTIDGINDWKVGDWAIFDGTVWRKVDNTDAVSSVNSLTGAVSLDSSNVPDTTNKRYITDAQLVVLGNTSGTNTGDQTKMTVISDTKTNFNTACSDGDFVFVGDVIADPAGWTTIVKSANQDVTNSATLVDDTDLQFSVVAGGHYMIELDAVISVDSATGDYKNAFNVSAGTMKGSGISISNSNGGVAQTTNLTASTAASTNSNPIGTALADLDMLFSTKIIYSFTASSNATFKYQFAQNTATLAKTARTWKGSILKYKRID